MTSSATPGRRLAPFWWSSIALSGAGALLVGAVAVARNRNLTLLAAFAASTLYSLVDPVLVIFRSGSWWRLALLSCFGWLVLFFLGAAVSEGMGTDAMVFLFPTMVFPFTLALGGLVRLLLRVTRSTPGGQAG